MKLRKLMSACLLGMAFVAFGQTHEQGIEYYKAAQYDNAQELLNRNLNNPGTDKALTYYYLGQIAARQGYPTQAAKYFNDGVQADANNPYNYVGLGLISLKNGDLKTAQKYFKDAESKAKKDADVLVDIARAYYDVDPVTYATEIEKKINAAQKKQLDNADLYILQGDMVKDQAFKSEDQKLYGKAAALYEMGIGYEPTSAAGYVKYAQMYSDLRNYPYAISKLKELLNNNPSSALGQRELANAQYENGNYKEAADTYSKYVQNPNHFKSDEDRYAFILFYDKRYKDGYDYATQLFTENPDNFNAQRFQFMNASYIPEMKDQLYPMATNLWKGHVSNPDYKTLSYMDYLLISDEMIANQEYDTALTILSDAIKNMPQYANDFKKSKALAESKLGDYGKATDTLIDYIESIDNPTVTDYYQAGAFALYAGLQRKDGVTPSTQAPFEVNEEEGQKYFNLGKQYTSIGLEMDPSNDGLQTIMDALNQY